jgi:hypothetical protein
MTEIVLLYPLTGFELYLSYILSLYLHYPLGRPGGSKEVEKG